MTIPDYLTAIEFATSHIIPTLWADHDRLLELEAEIAPLLRRVEDGYHRAYSVQANAEDADDVAMGAGMYFETYFGDDKQLHAKEQARKTLEEQIDAHAFSIASLAGVLLQQAKQGISVAHGGLPACPDGRLVGTQPLKSVIWQARNQALHWEAGNFHPPVQQCFAALASDIHTKFAEYTQRNLAFDVIDLLGWKTFESFRRDLLSLA